MMRILHIVLATSLLSIGAGAAFSAVHVNMAVDPQVIPQCSRAHFSYALTNDSSSPVGVRIGLALLREGQPLLGPFTVATRLAAGQYRAREFNFLMPPIAPLAHYAIVTQVLATDGSSDEATAPFEVVSGTCGPPSNTAPSDDLMRQILEGLLSSPTGVESQPWGAVKELYR